MRTIKITAIVLATLLLLFYILYRFALPKPNLTEVPNPIQDRASKDWSLEEAKVPINPLKNVYFGDLHVHTNLSLDAYLTGNTTDMDDAYSFAKGNAIEVVGNKVQLKQALDFTALTDHAEFMGEMYTYQNPNSKRHNAILARYIRSIKKDIAEEKNVGDKFRGLVYSPLNRYRHSPNFEGYETTKTSWTRVVEAAEKHYEPGKFTTLAGYEWTYGLIAHNHRNIIFRDMKVPDYPISSFEARDEEALWKALQHFTDHGATVLAIPHNSNLSGGGMFSTQKVDGSPIDKDYAALRQKFEKLVEVHQNKGNSEVYAEFWQNDEYADFENYYEGELSRSSFVRDALKVGLEMEEEFGVNPFKYGMIGSTDTHNSTPGNTEEDSGTPGQFGYSDASAKVRNSEGWAISGDRPPAKTYTAVNPGGLAAVWAEANTRGHIYDGLAAKETYATSGNRVQVRFFAGYNFKENYESYDSLVADGYRNGVPMGSDLLPPSSPDRLPSSVIRSPSFLLWATKDPEAANLDRIQVIKGWIENGERKEKIFNAIVSENGDEASVNVETGAWDTTKGAVELSSVWTDPEFNPAQRAFYYLRVIEVPTARWNLWDEIKYGVKYPEEVPKTIQERAWSSPIWYNGK